MIVLAMIFAVVLGLFYGMSDIEFTAVNFFTENTDLVLYLLMFSVGISIGMQKGIFSILHIPISV